MQNSAEALTQLQQAQQSAVNPNQFLTNQNQALGVNAAQDTVTGLRGAINNTTKLLQQVAPSIMGRTANSLVTSAQANKQIQNEQAPISQNLSNQSNEYNQSSQDLAQLQGRAQQLAAGEYQGQQDKLSYLQNIYNTLYQKERDEQARQQAEAARQEQIRQFNASLKASGSGSGGGGGYDLSGILGGSPGGASASAQWINNGASNQFKDAGGQGITAFQYAQQQGIGYRQLLSKMASAGDKNAQIALKFVGDNGVYGSAPAQYGGALAAVGARGNISGTAGGGGKVGGW